MPSLVPGQDYSPTHTHRRPSPRHHRQRRPVGGLRGERETTSPARPRAPEGPSWSAPGAPTEGQGERAPARPTGEARAARRRDAPSPPRGGAARKTQPGRPARRVSAASQRPRGVNTTEVGPGSAPLPLPHTAIRRGGRGEGPAGRARRAVPFAKECPSLVWRGLGPARESATSPHRSSGRAGANKHREEGRTRGADSRSERAWPLP